MSSESSDDLPLNARGYSPNLTGSEGGSPVPDWLSAHKVTAVPIELSSSDDADAASDEDDSDAEQNDQHRKPARGRQKPTAVKSKKGKQAAAELAADLDTATTPALAAADGHDSAEPTDGAGQQNCVEPGNVAKKKQKSATKPPGLLAAVAGNSGSLDQVVGKELPLMLPEKLPRNKALVELEPRPGGATDLAGDAGAVGRFMVAANAAGKEEVSIDLKGVVYSATVVPCATTLCVVNIGANEAKVECLLRSFVRLREQPGFSADDAGGADLFADDEDNYQMGATPDAAAEKKLAGAGKKPKGTGAKLKGAGGALKARGGVTKVDAGKPRPKGPAKPRKPAARRPTKAKG